MRQTQRQLVRDHRDLRFDCFVTPELINAQCQAARSTSADAAERIASIMRASSPRAYREADKPNPRRARCSGTPRIGRPRLSLFYCDDDPPDDLPLVFIEAPPLLFIEAPPPLMLPPDFALPPERSPAWPVVSDFELL